MSNFNTPVVHDCGEEPDTVIVNSWATRFVFFDEDGDPSSHCAITPLTDDQIHDLWIYRDCIAAISAGDVLAQVRCVVRAAELFHGIGDSQ